MAKEYALWGTKNGYEDIIRVNGAEVQKSLKKATNIKTILEKRKSFDKVRIQTLDYKGYDIKQDFVKGINKKRK